jgi:hypothetical protein
LLQQSKKGYCASWLIIVSTISKYVLGYGWTCWIVDIRARYDFLDFFYNNPTKRHLLNNPHESYHETQETCYFQSLMVLPTPPKSLTEQ